LTFGRAGSRPVDFDFPKLERPDPIIATFRARVQARRRGHESEELMLVPPGAQKILAALKKGTQKLEYGKTSKQDWTDYLRFATDTLHVQRGRGGARHYRIVEESQTRWTEGTPINLTRATAQDWFLNHLIPSLRENKSSRHYITGDPGCGKSTLMKYLINSNHEHLRTEGVVFCRFEFMKFMTRRFLNRGMIQRQLDEYLSFILLRDLVTSLFFSLDAAGGFKALWQGDDRIKKIIASLCTHVDEPKAKTLLPLMLAAKVYDLSRIWEIPIFERIILIKLLLESRMIVLVLDGLDYISVDDILSDTDRHFALDYLLSNLNSLSSFQAVIDGEIGLDIRPLTIIREGTLGIKLHQTNNDVGSDAPFRFQVQEIRPRVAAFNALQRSLAAFAKLETEGPLPSAATPHLLLRAIDGTMGIINVSVGAPFKGEEVFDLFGGNLRTLFEFIRRMLLWFVVEAVRDPAINFGKNTSPDQVLSAMMSKRGHQILVRRKYRLVELLLFSELPWFENVILAERPDPLLSALRRDVRSIVECDLFTGVLDNAFNYHDWTSKSAADKHSFLEKIRIMQILIDQTMASADLESALLNYFGYTTDSLKESLAILIRSEYLKFHFGHDNKLELHATARARFIVGHLCNEMSYLEHMFHRTLFPKKLFSELKDERREVGVDDWTTASIRNCFIFLTYLNFVESNRAGGVAVPKHHRITDRTQRRLRRTITRILNPRRRSPDDQPETPSHGAEVVEAATSQIEKLLERWRKDNLIDDVRTWDALSRAPTGTHERI
jgi:hypothetical protein